MNEDDVAMPPENFVPGSFGCHEAMHLTSVILDMVEEHLVDHPAVRAKPEWAVIAWEARRALCRLHQAIAREHMKR